MMGWRSVVIGQKVWMARKLSDHTTDVHEIMNKYDEIGSVSISCKYIDSAKVQIIYNHNS